MTLLQASFMLAGACLYFATLIAATGPARIHEARQGPVSTVPPTTDPGPQSIQTFSSTSTTPEAGTTGTMSPTPSSEPAVSSSSSASPFSTSSNTPSYASSSTKTPASPSPSPSPSSRTSAATPQPSSSTSNLTFAVQNMTTCTSGLISWSYSGKEAGLLLSITVPHSDAVLGGATAQQLADTNTSALSWTWPSVNLTQGWYEIHGLVLSSPIVSSDSSSFFISNGSDVTCLAGTSPQALSTASPSANAASKPNAHSIAGGVVGSILGVALAIIAGFYLWSRRRKSFIGRRGRKDTAWGSLKSTSSSIRPGDSGPQFSNRHFHAHSESTGAILQDVSVGKVSAATTPGGSDEDVVANEEKLVSPVSSSEMSPSDALNTPAHYDRRSSTYSIQTPIAAVMNETFRSHVSSLHTPAQTLEQQAQRIRYSMETPFRRRSERLSMPTLPTPGLSRLPHSPPHTQPNEEYPLTSMTPTPVNRSISAGAVSMTARRTPRKPVPQYDSSVLLEDKSVDSASTFTAGAESSQSHGTGLETGARGTPSDLFHKASFGDGRPVHYLIPDMPPPPQD